MRLRTVIMLVSMIGLPTAAVIGIKWPRWLLPHGATAIADLPTRDEGPIKPRPKTRPAADVGAAPWSAGLVPGQGSPVATAEGYPIRQASNTDVRDAASSAERLPPAAAPGDLPTEAALSALPIPSVRLQPQEAAEANRANDPFSQIQQRLRSLGATHYALETFGPKGDSYRFQCRMVTEQNPQYTRHFEATDSDPLRVMQAVLEEVEGWKAGRVP